MYIKFILVMLKFRRRIANAIARWSSTSTKRLPISIQTVAVNFTKNVQIIKFLSKQFFKKIKE